MRHASAEQAQFGDLDGHFPKRSSNKNRKPESVKFPPLLRSIHRSYFTAERRERGDSSFSPGENYRDSQPYVTELIPLDN